MNGLRDKVRYSLLSNVIKICFTIIKLQREKFKEAFRFNLWYINLGQSRILKSWQHCCWQRSINLSKLRTAINIQGKKIYIYMEGSGKRKRNAISSLQTIHRLCSIALIEKGSRVMIGEISTGNILSNPPFAERSTEGDEKKWPGRITFLSNIHPLRYYSS